MTRRFPDAAERIALFPGSFNPFTLGHKSLVDRALPLFDKIVVAIGYNSEKCAADDADLSARLEAIRAIYRDEPRVEVTAYSGLTVDACRECGARWMLRGVRSVTDFEYERTLADVNHRISGIETVILYTLPEYASISSSIVRELQHYGYATDEFLP